MSSESDKTKEIIEEKTTDMDTEDQELDDSTEDITEDSLISSEILDRYSPIMWPDNRFEKFAAEHTETLNSVEADWNIITSSDKKQIDHLKSLNENQLGMVIGKLLDEAAVLDMQEANEKLRGKLLGVCNNKKEGEKNILTI